MYKLSKFNPERPNAGKIALAIIPANEIELDLSGLNLGKPKPATVVRAMTDAAFDLLSGLPGSLIKLNLANNHLEQLSGSELTRRILKGSFKEIDYSGNHIGLFNLTELAPIIETWSKNCEKLALNSIFQSQWHNFNNFASKYKLLEKAKTVFANIQPTVNSLSFKNNCLDKLKDSELTELFKSLPNHVTHIDLSDNNLSKRANLVDLIDNFPRNGIKVTVDSYRYNRPQADASILKKKRKLPKADTLFPQETKVPSQLPVVPATTDRENLLSPSYRCMRVNDTILLNETGLAILKRELQAVVQEYSDYVRKECKLSFWHRHGETGIERAEEFLLSIKDEHDCMTLQRKIVDYLSEKSNGNTYNHSFRTMLLDRIFLLYGQSSRVNYKNFKTCLTELPVLMELPPVYSPAPQ
ncbi:hypothetical protein ACFORL_02260 [Legionella dresdenensis]|uniref:Leucine-rich repeat-containing protein n=1 Tax=Legionella dresdenensis TaxID=450200 RepID=A0ABV8CCA1_9GAMM